MSQPASELDDHKAIVDLINHYSVLVNQRRDHELKQFYAPGAVFDGLARFSIDEEFDDYLSYLQSLRDGDFPNLRQFLSPSAVFIEGDSAEAFTSVLLIATAVGESARIKRSGELHDRMVRTTSGWKFIQRTAKIDGT